MPTPPPACPGLGPQCRALEVTLLIATYRSAADSMDHEATWLLAHTERLALRNLRRAGNDLVVDATVRVRCRHLKAGASGADPARCAAHGFEGRLPPEAPWPDQPRRLGGDRFTVVTNEQLVEVTLPPPRSLPVVASEQDLNPCAVAPCTTADHKRGAACCRDMQIEMRCPPEDTYLEALVRSRQSPYLCKVTRESAGWLEAELISACAYLDDAGRNCTLHGRTRDDGRPAKPDLCSEWPDDGKGLHPGCLWYVAPGKTTKRA